MLSPGLMIFIVLFYIVYLGPQGLVDREHPYAILFMAVGFVLMTLYFFYIRMKQVIVDPNKEELEVHSEDIIKIYITKSDLWILFICIISSTMLLVYEGVFAQHQEIHIYKAVYSAEGFILFGLLNAIVYIMEQSMRRYFRMMKGLKIKKKP
jgi:hypothetical protein